MYYSPEAGYPFGESSSPDYFMMEVHYDNPQLITGRKDNSGNHMAVLIVGVDHALIVVLILSPTINYYGNRDFRINCLVAVVNWRLFELECMYTNRGFTKQTYNHMVWFAIPSFKLYVIMIYYFLHCVRYKDDFHTYSPTQRCSCSEWQLEGSMVSPYPGCRRFPVPRYLYQ